MRAGERMSGPHTVEVFHLVNGTTKIARFTADHATIQMIPSTDGSAIGAVGMVGGQDACGPVDTAFYAHAEVIIRRPVLEQS